MGTRCAWRPGCQMNLGLGCPGTGRTKPDCSRGRCLARRVCPRQECGVEGSDSAGDWGYSSESARES